MHVVNANSVDPDQTSRSVASDLGLHCLPMSHLWDTRHKWVDTNANIAAHKCILVYHLLQPIAYV